MGDYLKVSAFFHFFCTFFEGIKAVVIYNQKSHYLVITKIREQMLALVYLTTNDPILRPTKNISQIEHSRHRITNVFLLNLLEV